MQLPESDLEEIARLAEADCRWLTGKRILLTGGTGFIGVWFLALFDFLNREWHSGISCAVPSRDPEAFLSRNPQFRAPWLSVFKGDIRNFDFPAGDFDLVIHGATDVGNLDRAKDYRTTLDVCIEGTKRVLAFVKEKRASHLLLLSSGAVYGRQDPSTPFLLESSPCSLDPTAPTSAYGEGKRVAEWLVCEASWAEGFHAGIARCFAFSGPGLPLQGAFALGNFLSDAQQGHTIQITSDGTALRSYLYASDLIVWLLAVLHRGRSASPYHVGSDQSVSVGELARLVSHLPGAGVSVDVAEVPVPGRLPARYVPSIDKTTQELGVRVTVSLEQGLARHWKWLRGAS